MILAPSSSHCPVAWALTCQETHNLLLPTCTRGRGTFSGWHRAGMDRAKQVPAVGGKRVEGTSFFSRSLLIYHQQPCVLFFQGFLLNRDQFIILAPFLGREVERFGLQQSRVAWHFGREGERSRLSLVR